VVIRVTTLYASTASATARYYTRYLTDAPEEVPGQWAGKQADLLGLSATVSTDQLERLLSGHDPVSDVVLGLALKDRMLANGKTIGAVARFDATVSAPKLVSVLWGLTELTARFGVVFAEIVTGQAEIAGVPTELLELFSKRAVQVDDALGVKIAEFYALNGRDPTMWEKAALTREAAADTRTRKTDRPVSELRRWSRRLMWS
jgi:hypothetical protein